MIKKNVKMNSFYVKYLNLNDKEIVSNVKTD